MLAFLVLPCIYPGVAVKKIAPEGAILKLFLMITSLVLVLQ
jgi:hypothetical protein